MSQPVRLSVADLRASLAAAAEPTADLPHAARPKNPLGPPPDIETTPPVAQRDLVSGTFAAFRDNKPKGLRKGALASELAGGAPAPVAKPERSNKYPGTCTSCGHRVEAEKGLLTRGAGGWQTSHMPGDCPAQGAVEQAAAATIPATSTEGVQATIKAATGQVYTGLHPGTYTLATPGGYRTFRVRVQGTEEDFAPGKTILEYLSGPDNERDFTSFAFVNGPRLGVWKKHQDNSDLVAQAQYFLAHPEDAEVSKNCIRCGQKLTTPESLARGIGPTCIAKGW